MAQRVLDWRNRRSWLRAIQAYAGELLNPRIRGVIEKKRPKCWSDAMNWLPGDEDTVSEFTDRMSHYYSHVKGFHGCRPESLATYHEHGLRGQRPEEVIAKFRSIFSDVSESLLEEAIQKMQKRGDDERGKIWLTADDEEMVREYGHYIIHGSEYLLGLAAKISGSRYGGEDYRQRLKLVGIPTVLEVDIPIEMLEPEERRAVAKIILSEWGQLRAELPLGTPSTPCYLVREDIPASCIKGHYHPESIWDAHNNDSTTYYNRQLQCKHC